MLSRYGKKAPDATCGFIDIYNTVDDATQDPRPRGKD
jgi:hypothetical protein